MLALFTILYNIFSAGSLTSLFPFDVSSVWDEFTGLLENIASAFNSSSAPIWILCSCAMGIFALRVVKDLL